MNAAHRMLRQQGFSLLEVLVAFSILAISLGILYQAMGGSLRNLSVSAEYTQAMMIAESKLAEVSGRIPLASTTEEGDTESGFHWQVEVSPYATNQDTEIKLEPFHVHVSVSWKAGMGQRRYVLDTLRLNNPKGNR